MLKPVILKDTPLCLSLCRILFSLDIFSGGFGARACGRCGGDRRIQDIDTPHRRGKILHIRARVQLRSINTDALFTRHSRSVISAIRIQRRYPTVLDRACLERGASLNVYFRSHLPCTAATRRIGREVYRRKVCPLFLDARAHVSSFLTVFFFASLPVRSINSRFSGTHSRRNARSRERVTGIDR